MPTWTHINIPETPSPNFVLVKDIALQSSEATVKDFFAYCGKIQEFEMTVDDDGQHHVALIHFERESAAETAKLLSNALIDDSAVVISSYFTLPQSTEKGVDEGTNETAQESKPKSRIAAEILASGYLLHDQIVAKGLEYDHKYGLSSRFSSYLSTLQSNVKTLDEKYRVWDKAVEIDQKFKIQEKVQTAATTAQEKAQAALQSPTAQKARGLAEQTLAQIAAVHYEAKKIQTDRAIATKAATTA